MPRYGKSQRKGKKANNPSRGKQRRRLSSLIPADPKGEERPKPMKEKRRCLNLDILEEEGLCAWIKSMFCDKEREVPNVPVTEESLIEAEIKKLQEILEKETLKLQRKNRSALKLQSLIKSCMARRKYLSLMNDTNPSADVIRQFSHLLDPLDISFVQEMKLNTMKGQLFSTMKKVQQQKEELKSLDKDIEHLVTGRRTLSDLALRFKKLKSSNQEQIRKELIRQREEAREVRKGEEKLELYQHLFYYLQTEPKYLTKLICCMTDHTSVMSITDRLLFSLFNRASSQREEFHLLKLMESALCEEVETKLNCVRDILDDKLLVLRIIMRFYQQHKNYKTLITVLAPAVNEVLKFPSKLIANPVIPSTKKKSELNQIQDLLGLSIADRHNNEVSLYDMTRKISQAIFSSVYSIPYGLRYLAKVLQRSVQKKFPEATEDELLRTVAHVFHQYLQPALAQPEEFGLIAPEGFSHSVQRDNLTTVSQIFSQTMQSFPAEMSCAEQTSDFITKLSLGFRKFFKEALDVVDPETKLQYNKTLKEFEKDQPIVFMQAGNIIHTHDLLSKYQNLVFEDPDDIVSQLFQRIGPVPQLNDLLGGNIIEYGQKVCLCLSSLCQPTIQEFDCEMEKCLTSTKKLVLDVLRQQPGNTLLEILTTPASAAQEREHETRMEQATHDSLSAPGNTTDTCVFEDHNLSIESKKERIITNLEQIQDTALCSKAKDYQEILNTIAKEIKNKHELRQLRKDEIENTRQAIDGLTTISKNLQDRIDIYKDYRTQSVNTFLRPTVQDDDVDEIHFTEDMPPIFQPMQYTAGKLVTKRVIVATEGKFRDFKRKVITINRTINGFEVVLGDSVEVLPIVDLLNLHFSNVHTVKVFDFEVAVSMFLVLVCSKLSLM